MKRALQLDWDDHLRVVVKLLGEATIQDFIIVERLNLKSGETVTAEVSSPLSYCINGLFRDGRHLLIGIRSSVVCFDVDRMSEVCRARQIDGGARLEEGDQLELVCHASSTNQRVPESGDFLHEGFVLQAKRFSQE